MVDEDGLHEILRFTSALANGRDLYAFRYAANCEGNTLYYRSSGSDVVIVSEPLDNDHSGWVEVPENHMVVARAGRKAELVPFAIGQSMAAE
jgi:glutamine amidotransferase